MAPSLLFWLIQVFRLIWLVREFIHQEIENEGANQASQSAKWAELQTRSVTSVRE